ncbi:MAG: YggT family protein [Pseudomonadales bacterium]|nr:YggT family protein [Pseudomonadales bacterium]
MNPNQAFLFLIDTFIDIYCYIVFARFLLQVVKADFYNPVSQFVLKATNPILMPMRRVIPGFGGLDIASLILLIVLQVSKVMCITFLTMNAFPPVISLVIGSLLGIVSFVLNFFFFAIFLQVILSWISQGNYNPLAALLDQLTAPIMGPIRKVLPSMGGLDLSPMVALLGIQFIKILFGL